MVTFEGKDRRKAQPQGNDLEPVVLKKKFADALNGIALTGFKVGDRICVTRSQAMMLIAEGWATPVPDEQKRRPLCEN